MTSKLTDPCVLRSVEVGSVPREVARIPAARVEAGWSVLIEDRWFRVVNEPVLLGDDLDEDGGRVRLAITGPGVDVVDMAVFRRGERLWCRAPQPAPQPGIGCEHGDCDAAGPFTATDDGFRCPSHLLYYVLAETAGPGRDGDGYDRG